MSSETSGISSRRSSAVRAYRAPGRVNIVGEHIDYLGGLVLPFACDLEVICEIEPLPGTVELVSRELPGIARVSLDDPGDRPDGWTRHVWGVVRTLLDEGAPVTGVRGSLSSTIPVGAGLSSSAAFEVVVAMAITGGARPSPDVLARAEELATGVPCGVMDQTTVLNARAGHALLLDCSTGAFEHVAVPESIGFVVIDTGTRRELADGRYAARRIEVENAFERAGLTSLDDAETSDEPRLRHALTDQRRVREGADALRAGDVAKLGAVLDASQSSLRDDFGVSSRALDLACEVARAQTGCHGARLVGAGFAGCVVAVTDSGRETEVGEAVANDLRARLPHARAFRVRAVSSAGTAPRSET